MAKRRSLSSKKGVQEASGEASSPKKSKVEVAEDGDGMEAKFLGEPVTANEAKTRWPKRYQEKVMVAACFTGLRKAVCVFRRMWSLGFGCGNAKCWFGFWEMRLLRVKQVKKKKKFLKIQKYMVL
jgi:hypothetical protein